MFFFARKLLLIGDFETYSRRVMDIMNPWTSHIYKGAMEKHGIPLEVLDEILEALRDHVEQAGQPRYTGVTYLILHLISVKDEPSHW